MVQAALSPFLPDSQSNSPKVLAIMKVFFHVDVWEVFTEILVILNVLPHVFHSQLLVSQTNFKIFHLTRKKELLLVLHNQVKVVP